MLRHFFAAAMAACLFTPSLSAQVLYGSLIGNVRDASDAVVPEATVTITNKETGQVRVVQTDRFGLWQAPTIQAGIYKVEVRKEGFRTTAEETSK